MMFEETLILRTKLKPPRVRPWTLIRSRLINQLEATLNYRLTLLVAPTGYGKSTVLSSWLDQTNYPYVWYNVGLSDSDPLLFLLHLFFGFREHYPGLGDKVLTTFEQISPQPFAPQERHAITRQLLFVLINELSEQVNQDTFLIIDDFHFLEKYPALQSLCEELIEALPPLLHVVISSRQRPLVAGLARYQAQHDLLYLGKEILAFTQSETIELFSDRFGYTLSFGQAAKLVDETEGWIIALQMVWQNLQSSQSDLNNPLNVLLKDLPRNLPGLFDYLAQEVLNHQPQHLQRFLLDSSMLRRMSGPLCDFVLNLAEGESEAILRSFSENGLFVILLGDEVSRSYRYHHLFGEFLYARLHEQTSRATQLHLRAAKYYHCHHQPEEVLHHLLAAQAWQQAAELMASGLGQHLLENGQLEKLEHWLSHFPPTYLDLCPALLLLQGDNLRLTSRFNVALESYQKAEICYREAGDFKGQTLALRGQALVYLDTVQPAAAEEWLEKALAISKTTQDCLLQATVLRDLAENKLNRGRPLEALKLNSQARTLTGEVGTVTQEDVRILLRSGQLSRATELLENAIEVTGENSYLHRPGRSHREGLLVLSLLDATQGQGEKAEERARCGIVLARELHTPFTEAVAWVRLGHALTVNGQFEQALEAYQNGIKLGDSLNVRRLRAEASMGMCLLQGGSQYGNLSAAREAARDGLLVAQRAGDEWIEGFLNISLASALVGHDKNEEAVGVAQIAFKLLKDCGDCFGQTVAKMWEAVALNDTQKLQILYQECESQGYTFLFERSTLFGIKSEALLQRTRTSIVSSKAPSLNITLSVKTLGAFEVIRPDGSQIETKEWQRDKARQLFQLLLIYREKPIPKDQIIDFLWPSSDQEAGEAGFKVALNALLKALEPKRSSRAQSSYVIRSGSGSSLMYKLQTENMALDAVEFEMLAAKGLQAETAKVDPAGAIEYYEEALSLYRGNFLPGCIYEDWAAPERERLLSLYLTVNERLARLRAHRSEWNYCAATCRVILEHDNCWEEAYYLLMLAQWKQNNRAAALRTWQKCVDTLASELGLEPGPATTKLYLLIYKQSEMTTEI